MTNQSDLSPGDSTRFDEILADQIEEACNEIRELQASPEGIPTQASSTLRRTPAGRLVQGSDEETDWRRLMVAVTRRKGFWDRIADVARALADDPDVDAAVGWDPEPTTQATTLWQQIIGPISMEYGWHRPDWVWDPQLAQDLVKRWRSRSIGAPQRYRTIAPLHNIKGVNGPLNLDENISIRPMTDDDRQLLWRKFGGPYNGLGTLTVGQLETWTDVIDVRWTPSVTSPFRIDEPHQKVAMVVTALRLHDPGVTGTTIVWTRPDQPDGPMPSDHRLYEPHGAGLFMHPLQTHLEQSDAKPLRALLSGLSSETDNRLDLALRRFNRAYERYSSEDSLIDLWVAFEALLVPDGSQELRYRASLRIARFAAQTSVERKRVFRLARDSYDVRSKVVHGSSVPDGLDKTVEQTRQLARKVLQAWVLNPPQNGVSDIDDALLA